MNRFVNKRKAGFAPMPNQTEEPVIRQKKVAVLPPKVLDKRNLINPFDFDPTDEQINTVLLSSHNLLKVDAVAGSAKEQPVSCTVYTPEGPKRLGDIVVGDYVIGKNGKPTKVLGVYSQGNKKVYEVHFRDGSSTRCGIEHNWSVKSINWRTGYKTLTLSEILDHGLTNNHGNCKLQVPMCEAVDYSKKDLPVPPYVLGCLLGDGTFTGSTPSLSYHKDDAEILHTCLDLLSEQYGVVFYDKSRNTSDKGRQTTLTHKNKNGENLLATDLRWLNLNVGSFYKRIPDHYMTGSREQRWSLLRGLMDTDGSISKNRTSFCTVSPALRDGVRLLVQSLGGTCIETKKRVRETDHGGNTVYNLNIKMFDNPFSLKRKRSGWKFSSKNPPSRYITSVVDSEEYEEQVCIRVDAEDSLYLTDEYIVTHNTSTCEFIAANYLDDSLYLAFNKKMADEAKSKFPDHVECRTTHSLAFKHIGVNFTHKLQRPVGRYRNVAATGSEIARYFKVPEINITEDAKFTASLIGLLIKQCVAKFEQSSDDSIESDHLPFASFQEQEKKFKTKLSPQDFKLMKRKLNQLQNMVLEYARDLWEERTDALSPVLITHDTYLKMYQMTKPVLPFERIYLDEAQDTSACVMDIFLHQKDTAKLILVGDKYQQIYAWRGALNALQSVQCETSVLTQSFRYGEEVAAIARKILGDEVDIKGNPNISAKVGLEGVIDDTKPYTMIFRTNANLLAQAVIKVSEGELVNIEVDITDFVKKLESAQALFDENMKQVKHEEIVPYTTWEELVTEAKFNKEISRIQNLVESRQVFNIINTLKTYKKPNKPHITMSTCHKMKGLERDQIWLADDFPSVYDKNGKYVGLTDEERNLLYVAVTRAKFALEYNSTVAEIMDGYNVSKSKVQKVCDNGVQVGVKGVGCFEQGATDKETKAFLDRTCNEEYYHQAHENWLEEGSGEFDGMQNLLPTLDDPLGFKKID